MQLIEIDGSYGEGGGQIIRMAVALAAITGNHCKIINIRKGRKNPGLQAQHLKGIEAVAKLCDAELKGAKLHSSGIEFIPKEIRGGHLSIDVGTAGSISLVLQALVVPSIHADKEVSLEITGGTDVHWSPTTTYFQHIFCDFLKKMNIDIHIETLKYGFYPKGGGKVKVIIKPCKELKSINLTEREELERIDVRSIASEFLKSNKVAERQIEGLKRILKTNREFIEYVQTLSPGSSLNAYAHFKNCKLGASVIGERGKPAERIGEETANNLIKQINSKACLDEHMADQILPYMALAGDSKVSVAEITNHCKTNMWLIKQFLDVDFKIENNLISCKGIDVGIA